MLLDITAITMPCYPRKRKTRSDAGKKRLPDHLQNTCRKCGCDITGSTKSAVRCRLCSQCYRTYTMEWRNANRWRWQAIANAGTKRRRALKRRAGPLPEWAKPVMDFCFGNRCLCCGQVGDTTIDHITPLTKGGRNGIDNLQTLCAACNSTKHRETIDYRTAADRTRLAFVASMLA